MARPKKPDSKVQALRDAGALNPRADLVRDFLFLQNEFFDRRDLLQVKYEMIRRVQKEGRSISETVAAFGVSRPSFYKAKRDLAREGLHGLLPRRRGPRGRHKLTEEVIAFVLEVRAKDPGARADVLVQRIREKFGITVHPRTVERVLASTKKKRR